MILVVEDNLINQDVFRVQLDLLGYKSVIVNNGVEAMMQLRNNEISIVLTDCYMPEMDGFQLAMEIRKIEKEGKKRIPIIAVTADVYVDKDRIDNDSNFDEFVTKPLSLDKLSAIINKWMPK